MLRRYTDFPPKISVGLSIRNQRQISDQYQLSYGSGASTDRGKTIDYICGWVNDHTKGNVAYINYEDETTWFFDNRHDVMMFLIKWRCL